MLSRSGRHTRVNYPTCTCGAHALLRRFVAAGADQRALTLALRPTRADYVLLLVAAMACRAEKHYRPMWEEVESGRRPLIEVEPHCTEILLWAATSEDLRSGNGESRHFPAECFRLAPFLRPHQTLYRFKFVQPGTTEGTTYDGLVRARHRWVLLPEPWQLLDAAQVNVLPPIARKHEGGPIVGR
jgi:hypothetical protein